MNKLKRIHFNATGRDVHVDVPLSNVAIDYRPEGLIADMIAPVVPVPNISGSYAIFDREERLRSTNDLRAPGTEANKVSRKVSSDNFYCIGRALQYPVTQEDLSNADPIYTQKLYNGAAEYLTGKLHLNWEIRVANMATSGTNVGSYTAVGSSWSDTTNSDPLADLLVMRDNIMDRVGIAPNRVVFGETAWRYARRNQTVRNLIFGTNNGGGFASRQAMADLLDVQEVMVGAGYKTTNDEGQSEVISQIWDNNVLMYYAPPNPSRDVPSFMYSMRWAAPGIPQMQAERHPFDSKTKSQEVEVGYYQTEKITGAEYGFLLIAVDSST